MIENFFQSICWSILNPYLIYSLNETYLKGTKIFTPTLGWSSYLYGFFECSHVKEYVGTDVINDVCKKTKEFAKTYNKKCTIYCKPSEKLLDSESFSKKYKNIIYMLYTREGCSAGFSRHAPPQRSLSQR